MNEDDAALYAELSKYDGELQRSDSGFQTSTPLTVPVSSSPDSVSGGSQGGFPSSPLTVSPPATPNAETDGELYAELEKYCQQGTPKPGPCPGSGAGEHQAAPKEPKALAGGYLEKRKPKGEGWLNKLIHETGGMVDDLISGYGPGHGH